METTFRFTVSFSLPPSTRTPQQTHTHTHTPRQYSESCLHNLVLTSHELEIIKYCVSDNMQRIISHSYKDTILYHTDTFQVEFNKTEIIPSSRHVYFF
jgi:hypothetical protein